MMSTSPLSPEETQVSQWDPVEYWLAEIAPGLRPVLDDLSPIPSRANSSKETPGSQWDSMEYWLASDLPPSLLPVLDDLSSRSSLAQLMLSCKHCLRAGLAMPAAGAPHRLVAVPGLQIQTIAHCFPAPPDLQVDHQLVSTQGEQQQLLAAAQRQLQGERAATVAAATARRLAGAEGSAPAAGWVLAALNRFWPPYDC